LYYAWCFSSQLIAKEVKITTHDKQNREFIQEARRQGYNYIGIGEGGWPYLAKEKDMLLVQYMPLTVTNWLEHDSEYRQAMYVESCKIEWKPSRGS